MTAQFTTIATQQRMTDLLDEVVGAANSLLCEDGVAENLVQFNCLFILSDAIAELEK